MPTAVRPIPIRYFLPAPTTPTVANAGAPGVVTYTYKVVDYDDGAGIAVSAAGTTTTGAASLDETDYNTLTLVANPRATRREVWLTAGPGALGLLGEVDPSATTYDDQVGVGDAATLPVAVTTGIGDWVEVRDMREKVIQLDGTFTGLSIQFESTLNGTKAVNEGSPLTATSAFVDAGNKVTAAVRAKMTAITTGDDVSASIGGQLR